MKVIRISLLAMFAFVINMQAQQFRNIVLKTKNNTKFTAYVNQKQINRIPLSEVVITGLTDDYYKVSMVTVSNKSQNYNLYAAPFSEIVYVLNLNNTSPNRNYFIEDVYPMPANSVTNSFDWNENNGNVNNGYGQINININNQVNTQQNNDVVVVPPNPPMPPIIEEVVYLEGYDGPIGCEQPLNKNRFRSMLATIKKQSFSSSKKRIAKQIISANCILTDDLVEIIELFDFESDKLAMAKFAFDHTYDIENYYKVNNVFDFESSIEELDQYIRGK